MIKRELESAIELQLFQKKVILLFGARQVGKTTLLNSLSLKTKLKTLFLNGDERVTKELLTDESVNKLKVLFGENQLVVIDEAQNIQNIGTILKLAVDSLPNIQVIATGSSAFELANKANEPLTGRKFEFRLNPISFSEMVTEHGYLNEYQLIEHRMVFGYYPEIVNHLGNEEKRLELLASSYLYKDILILDQIKLPKLVDKILKALALQVGNEVTYQELAQLVGADKQTVEKYIDILEQAYIIFKLPGFSRNVRNEIKKGKKIYFYDNGIRNAIIGNYLPLHSRSDVGALWENFLISERVKMLNNQGVSANFYFWRTTQQQEIDYIEERKGILSAFEFKWNQSKKTNLPKTFSEAYPNTTFNVISRNIIDSFLLDLL